MINSKRCIGCQACVDICPFQAIRFIYNEWGEGKAIAVIDQCRNCGLCDSICPSVKADMFQVQDMVYAAVSKKYSSTGSSGGVFYELAKRFIDNNGVVYGAAFDDSLKLVHKRATSLRELTPLCKSKYLHSDMCGIYKSIQSDLKSGKQVMFIGTPCQASAVKNLFGQKYPKSLVIIDFLCHGTGTQKVFDACVHVTEAKHEGKIIDFQFRAKSRKAEHSFRYKLKKNNETRTISGYAFEFPFYYSYLKYTIFGDACYSCRYAKNKRVGDITLGDFWKIQNYNSKLHDQKGVSMLSVNSVRGQELLNELRDDCELYQYPIAYAVDSNQSFHEPEAYPKRKKELVKLLITDGEEALVQALSCPDVRKNLLYAKMPSGFKKIYQTIRGRL